MAIRISNFPLCRHLKTDGRNCKSASLRTSAYCHHHQKLHRTRPRTISPEPALAKHFASPMSDRQSFLRACGLIAQALAAGRLDNRTAGRMLYTLQLASSQLKATSLE
jgi:hypothetical protein